MLTEVFGGGEGICGLLTLMGAVEILEIDVKLVKNTRNSYKIIK